MKQAVALSLLFLATTAAAQTVAPIRTLRPAAAPAAPDTANIQRADPIRLLQDQVAELKAQVAALKQANDALAAKVQSLDQGVGQTVVQNVTQAKQIKDLTSDLGGLTTKFENHHHAFKYKRLSFKTESFVTEVGGIGKSDKYGNATVVTGTFDDNAQTGPAEQ